MPFLMTNGYPPSPQRNFLDPPPRHRNIDRVKENQKNAIEEKHLIFKYFHMFLNIFT